MAVVNIVQSFCNGLQIEDDRFLSFCPMHAPTEQHRSPSGLGVTSGCSYLQIVDLYARQGDQI